MFSGGKVILSGKIVVLPDHLTNKIAAGEVIERPASILKELLENALDAGATDIKVELERGGCGSIRVTDDGEGIDQEDAALAFCRFATSKIYQFDDIYKVQSFGFRGEALPSIASISRVEMVTRQRDALAGTRVIVEAGDIKEITETGCPAGTSVYVTNIFEPVPVRRKFLKSEHTEQGYCMDVISRLAISHTDLRLKVLAKGKEMLNIPAARDASERLALVLGTDFLDQMLLLTAEKNGIRLHGFASQPGLTRANSRHIYCFVNRRFIRDHLINNAIMTAYRSLIESKRYPVAVLLIDLPPHDVDVNVHPAKLEVRFRNPRDVYQVVVETLTGALGGSPLISRPPEGGGPPRADFPATPNYSKGVEEALKRYTLSSPSYSSDRAGFRRPYFPQTTESQLFKGSEGTGESPGLTFSDLNFLGQIGGAYLIFAAKDRMIIVDQHAAHERILFEKLKRKSADSDSSMLRQRLLMPEVISLPPRDFAFLMDCLPLLERCGFEIEPFGNDAIALKSVPSLVAKLEPKRMIMDFLEGFAVREVIALDEQREKIYAFLACKGAIKAQQDITPAEVKFLCKDLDSIPNASTCPHGRPVIVSFTFSDLEKMFKRR